MEFRLELTREHGPRRAGAFAERALHRWEVRDPGASLMLVVTELVENVFQHTSGDGELRLALRAGGILVRVFDSSVTVPAVQDPRPDQASGRGLRLVQALTRGWGVELRNGGKVVWAELPLTSSSDGGGPAYRSVQARAATDATRGRSTSL